MSAVPPVVPLQRLGEEPCVRVDSAKAAVLLGVRVEHNPICACDIDTDAVVLKALCWVEVESKHHASPLKDDDLVTLVLERDVRLGSMQPAILVLAQVHGAVKVVEELIPKEAVLGQVQLAASIPERVLIALAGEVQPLGVTKLVALKVEVALASESMGQQTDHLVQGHTAVNNRGQWGERRHMGVELSVAQMHHERLVTDKTRVELASK